MDELIEQDDYLFGTELLGAEPYYGPESPEDLAKANRALTPAEKVAANEWKTAHPPWLQQSTFGGLKHWQVLLGGAGILGIVSGVGIAIFGGRKR